VAVDSSACGKQMLLFCTISAVLKSLQGAGGAYCLVTAGKNHEVRGGSLRGFSEGDNIRVVRPKLDVQMSKATFSATGTTL
jgi:hypothetical protein